MKIDLAWTSILRPVDVGLILLCRKNILCTEIKFWKDCVCLVVKIKC